MTAKGSRVNRRVDLHSKSEIAALLNFSRYLFSSTIPCNVDARVTAHHRAAHSSRRAGSGTVKEKTMRKATYLAASVLAVAAISDANAQCNRRGGGGGTATGTVSPIATSAGFSSPLSSLNSINTSSNATFLAAQYRSQLAQYQNMLAQQRRYIQMMAQRQQILERQIQQLRNGEATSSAEQFAVNSADSSKERRRQQNAEKALQLASRAEAGGRTSTAKAQYRRVIRIVGTDSELGRRASEALAALTGGAGRDKTMLASDNIR
jgi:hypothetical protein